MTRRLAVLAALALGVAHAAAFYLPGIAPVDYRVGQPVEVLANKLASPRSKLPFDYYSLPFCPVADGAPPRGRRVNLGQMLVGERALPTAFDIRMLTPVKCAVMCNVALSEVTRRQLRGLRARIRQDYSVRLNADNMPLVTRGHTRSGMPAFRFGYKLGYVRPSSQGTMTRGGGKALPQVFINNHLLLTVLYNSPVLSRRKSRLQAAAAAAREAAGVEPLPEAYRVVGFEVQAMSVAAEDGGAAEDDGRRCSASLEAAIVRGRRARTVLPQPQRVAENETVVFSYTVAFKESDLLWATRWDPLLVPNAQLKRIQWFSIVNSLMIGLFLTGLVGAVMLRTVLRDFSHYKQLDEAIGDDQSEEATGWKLVHGDVFRAPPCAPLLAICVGSGAQVFVMAFCTQVLALLGFLSPANRGGLLSALLTLFVMASTVAGFVTSRVYLSMETSTPRRTVTGGAAILFPGICFAVFFLLNIAVSFTGSSGSVGFGTLILLWFMWFGISLPLVFVGAFIAYRQKRTEHPVRTNQIPRSIPCMAYHSKPEFYALPAGVLPFGTVFMELVFLLNAVNQGSVYYLYGALISVFAILLVTCAELSIVFTYLTLSAENWKWQWPSFMTTASSGVYVFLYAMYYLFSQPSFLEGGERAPLMSWVLYTSYMMLVSGAFSLMCGCVGYFASQGFVRKLYNQVRVD